MVVQRQHRVDNEGDGQRPEREPEDRFFMGVEDWLASGRRVQFDPTARPPRIVREKTENSIAVFERVVLPVLPRANTLWLTLLPGFPVGSYGYAKVDSQLNTGDVPRLYVEYVGQGDSDKPTRYNYSTMERADLVEAQWKSHCVQRTVVIAFDYSSIVTMELLQRQRERYERGERDFPRIEHVLLANGHSHPYTDMPLFKTRACMAHRSNLVLDHLLKPLWSSEYRATELTARELRETEKIIRLHRGAAVFPKVAGFVDDYKKCDSRWNFYKLYVEFCRSQGIAFQIVSNRGGGGGDRVDDKHRMLERECDGTGNNNVKFDYISGGHLSTSERASELVKMIEESLVQHRQQQRQSCLERERSVLQQQHRRPRSYSLAHSLSWRGGARTNSIPSMLDAAVTAHHHQARRMSYQPDEIAAAMNRF